MACLSSSDVLWSFGQCYNNMLMTYVVFVFRASIVSQDSECLSVSIGLGCTNTLKYELLTLKALTVFLNTVYSLIHKPVANVLKDLFISGENDENFLHMCLYMTH